MKRHAASVSLLLSPVFVLACSLTACAVNYPKHEPEKAFRELKIYDAQGRPYRAAREDWKAARRRIVDDAAWSEWFQAEKGEVDRWMTKHDDRVSWVAG